MRGYNKSLRGKRVLRLSFADSECGSVLRKAPVILSEYHSDGGSQSRSHSLDMHNADCAGRPYTEVEIPPESSESKSLVARSLPRRKPG